MADHLSTETVTVGEGFAFFRWHCLKWPFSGCLGFNDSRAACDFQWVDLNRG
jgi:hypothetical protein